MQQSKQKPSLVLGLRSAWRMRRLVITVWMVGFAVVIPASFLVDDAVLSALDHLPDDWVAPAGEEALLVTEAMAPVLEPLAIVLGSALVLVWFFTVLWHAGVARFEVWGGGPPAVSHILGLGLTAWWPYFRLSMIALVVLFALGLAVSMPVVAGVTSAFEGMEEERMVLLLAAGLVAGAFVKFIVWAATLRGAWELAEPTSRSALRAWFRGLAGVFRSPLSSFGTLVILGGAMIGSAASPLIFPWLWPVLRGSTGGTLLAVAAGLGAAFFSVALFCAFAPVSGLLTSAEEPS